MNRISAGDYERQLLALRPPGPAWANDDPLLSGLAVGLARVHNRALDLIEEGDPRTTYEMLPAWEFVSFVRVISLAFGLTLLMALLK